MSHSHLHTSLQPKNQSYDLCINGAGPVGSTLACLLAQKGLRILILERNPLITEPNPALDGRAYALAEGIRPLLEESEIWQDLPHIPQAITRIDVIDSPQGASSHKKHILSFNEADAPEDRAFGWMVEAYDLLASCAKNLQKYENITILSPNEGEFSFKEDHVHIRCGTQEFTAPLLIAADGRRSHLRQQAKIPLTTIPYHKNALVTVITHEKPHYGSALEHFLPSGPFARLPLPSKDRASHRSAIVITDQESQINRLQNLSQEALTHYISERLGDLHLGAITHIGKRWIYPLSSQYAHSYHAHRLLLIGDAAHGLHPVAGQGMNVGFRDVKYLTPLLIAAFQNQHDLGAKTLLENYQRMTRPHNLAMLAGCDMMERIFSNKKFLLTRLRSFGLFTLEHAPSLRKKFILKAMGL